MKATVALKLDATLLREIQTIAEEKGTSISALLAPCFEEIMRERKTYKRARKRALARLSRGFNLQWKPHRLRDKLHQR